MLNLVDYVEKWLNPYHYIWPQIPYLHLDLIHAGGDQGQLKLINSGSWH